MVDDVVVRQRLLDQEQVEIVERLERRQVVERVSRVGIDLKRDRGKSLANPAHDVDIPARRDLELDSPVAFLEVARDQVEERLRSELSIPRLTPERISARVPPSSECSGWPASAGQAGPSRPSPAPPARSDSP